MQAVPKTGIKAQNPGNKFISFIINAFISIEIIASVDM